MNMTFKQETRPCIVTPWDTFGKVEPLEATFHGIYQRAHTTEGLLVGTVSGQYAEPVAVVEIAGQLDWVPVKWVTFTDVVSEQE